jgi:hypothetical protein
VGEGNGGLATEAQRHRERRWRRITAEKQRAQRKATATATAARFDETEPAATNSKATSRAPSRSCRYKIKIAMRVNEEISGH